MEQAPRMQSRRKLMKEVKLSDSFAEKSNETVPLAELPIRELIRSQIRHASAGTEYPTVLLRASNDKINPRTLPPVYSVTNRRPLVKLSVKRKEKKSIFSLHQTHSPWPNR